MITNILVSMERNKNTSSNKVEAGRQSKSSQQLPPATQDWKGWTVRSCSLYFCVILQSRAAWGVVVLWTLSEAGEYLLSVPLMSEPV